MDNATRLRRLRELASLLSHHDTAFEGKLKFNMRVWKCGTAACALGSAACHIPFQKEGLKMVEGNIQDIPYCGSSAGYKAGADFFGVTVRESEDLFNPESYGFCATQQKEMEAITTQQVTDRVKTLIIKYEKEGTING